MFAKGPYGQVNNGAELYVQNNRNTANTGDTSVGQEMWIVGSGDGGRSWHNLATIKHPSAPALSMAEGIVGVGSVVELEDESGGRFEVEISSVAGGISTDSPLGSALVGAKVGDAVDEAFNGRRVREGS